MPRNLGNGLVLRGLSQFRGILHEEVGLLVRCGGNVRIIVVENTAKNPREEYALSIDAINEANELLDEGEVVIGVIHTHLEHHPSRPSSGDLEGARNNPNALHLVYKPSTGELTEYDASGSRSIKRRKVVRRKNGQGPCGTNTNSQPDEVCVAENAAD